MKRRSTHWGSGGKHQRLARAVVTAAVAARAAGSQDPVIPETLHASPLDGDAEVNVLLELWSLGLMSAVLLQSIAAAACVVAPRPTMRNLAKIGAAGAFQGNAHRDLERQLNRGPFG